jgi:hypothetical protein
LFNEKSSLMTLTSGRKAEKPETMMRTRLKTMVAVAAIGSAALSLATPANAGNGNALGIGIMGLAIGAIVGSALTPTEVYVVWPPELVAYGPPAWTPAWYRYCRALHGPYFNPRSGYFAAADGGYYFCR